MSQGFVLAPQDFVTPPFRTCRKCGRDEFGTFSVVDREITRGCRACLHTESRTLPGLAKKVVYLDQFVLSNMAKALDPVWRKERPQQAPFWLDLFDALDRAVHLQLVVCPRSPIHERESVVHEHFDTLRLLYEYLSVETEFEPPEQVYDRQLYSAFRCSLCKRCDREPGFKNMPRHWAIAGAIDSWADNNFQIHIHPRATASRKDRERTSRSGQLKVWEKLWAFWNDKRPSFEQTYLSERSGRTRRMLELYRKEQEDRSTILNSIDANWARLGCFRSPKSRSANGRRVCVIRQTTWSRLCICIRARA